MAKKTITSKIELPLTLADVQVELETMARDVNSLIKESLSSLEEGIKRSFETAGGCVTCRGRGWVVVWDTMDSMTGCYAEYGACPNVECTEETRARSGLHPFYGKYDRNKGVKDPVISHPAYNVLIEPFNEQYYEICRNIKDLSEERVNFRKGDDVVVVKGRKVPVGTRGRVAWVSANTGGILVKPEESWQDRTADGIWINPANLEKVRK